MRHSCLASKFIYSSLNFHGKSGRPRASNQSKRRFPECCHERYGAIPCWPLPVNFPRIPASANRLLPHSARIQIVDVHGAGEEGEDSGRSDFVAEATPSGHAILSATDHAAGVRCREFQRDAFLRRHRYRSIGPPPRDRWPAVTERPAGTHRRTKLERHYVDHQGKQSVEPWRPRRPVLVWVSGNTWFPSPSNS